jgi:DNA-binding MarR family transcriptional regulator
MAEFIVLKGIKDHTFDSGEISIPDLLCISRAAVSQMLGGMEHKGYIIREVNQENRRKQLLSLTETGDALVAEQEQKVMELLAEIASRFGERETKQLMKLSNRFMDML